MVNKFKRSSLVALTALSAAGLVVTGLSTPTATAGNLIIELGSFEEPAVAGHVPGEIIVKFAQVPDLADLATVETAFPMVKSWRTLTHGAHYKNQPDVPHPLSYYRVANVDPSLDESELATQMSKAAGVVIAETNGFTQIAFTPNDPKYGDQYGPQIIRSEEAWDITMGDANVIVAIADTGLNFTHEDLADGVWANDDPVNGVDDDNNGFIDDWRGWDFLSQDNDPLDQNGHGSHVAGTTAARTDNSKGIAGMAQVTIMPLQVFNSGGGGTWEAIAEAIVYATDNGASLLNYSGGGGGGAQVVADAAVYAWDNGMPVVAAAGNWGLDTPFYPAFYDEVIAVAATDRNDQRAGFSNFGNWLDVAAPGVDILSCVNGASNAYGEKSGTSMASPHCAGLVALMYSIDSSLTPQEVRDLLRDNAKDLGDPGFDKFFGWGRIDAAATLQNMGPGDCLNLQLDQLVGSQQSTWTVTGGAEGEKIALVYGFNNTPQTVDNVMGFCATFGFNGVSQSRLVNGLKATNGGSAVFTKFIPGNVSGTAVKFQAAQQNTCPDECVSNILDEVVQ